MSILIKNMEMPKNCLECPLVVCTDVKSDCPLAPVPPHGRLIEESKVLDIVSEWCPDDDGSVCKVGDLREMLDEIEALPTIIPAEEGE